MKMTKKNLEIATIESQAAKLHDEKASYNQNGNANGHFVAISIHDENNNSTNNIVRDNPKKTSFMSKIFCCCRRKSVVEKDGKNELDLAKEVNIKEHLYSLAELEQNLQTSTENGLSTNEAEFRLKRDGPNAFSPVKGTPWWIQLLEEFTAGFAILFWIAAIASLVCYFLEWVASDYILTIVLIGVVLIMGTWAWSQKVGTGRMMDSFNKMVPPATTVIRDGKQGQVSADQLVVGDVVLCKGGERIPADVRIIRCEGMKVDNSSLTGESEPLTRYPDAGHQLPLEAKNLAFFSTSCVDGSGVGVVIATGDNTVMGKIATLVTNLDNGTSPITKEVNRFVIFIAIMACIEGVVFFVVCVSTGMNIFTTIIFTIGIITGNIPEGLLPSITVSLTLTAKRLASMNCMIKFLEAVEILGSTSVICSDKTGTLTENRMTVEHVYLASRIVHVSHDRTEVEEDMREVPQSWSAFQRCAKLCSRAFFIGTQDDILKRDCSGDASETGILKFMESVSAETVEQFRKQYPKVAERPFSSVYKYQYSVHQYTEKSQPEDPNFFLVMKGAPERILKVCSRIINEYGNTVELNEEDVENFENAYRELGSMGERVLAFCDMELPGFGPNHKFNLDERDDFEIKDLRFLGLIAMIDPPKGSVPDAVAKCKVAGISVIMVTGDHPITAQAIAKQVGIITASHRRSTQISIPKIDKKVNRMRNTASIVVPGDELGNLSDERLREILSDFNEIVFARTSPQQKLRIVENFQFLGKIVAVTGDGVNDSPALKKADIGVSMGITGSDVSKQAADMILMDDNFASIVVGVEEGRKIFDNLKKTTSYVAAGNVATLYPFIIFMVFGFPIPITSLIILLICLGTDLLPAISLSYEKAEADIMSLQPRNPKKDFLVTRTLILWSYFQGGFIVTGSGYMGYFVTMMQYGWMPWQLWNQRNDFTSEGIMTDYYGQETTLDQRTLILTKGQSAYFVSVVVCQWMDVIVNKTRRVSIFKHGMGNWFTNFAILFETALLCLIIYTPGLNEALTCTAVSGWPWVTGVPFFFYMLVYEELRKYIVRTWPNSWMGEELAR